MAPKSFAPPPPDPEALLKGPAYHEANKGLTLPVRGVNPLRGAASRGMGFSLGQGGLASAAMTLAHGQRQAGVSTSMSKAQGQRHVGTRKKVATIFGHDSSEEEG
jgi:hypothetical protein